MIAYDGRMTGDYTNLTGARWATGGSREPVVTTPARFLVGGCRIQRAGSAPAAQCPALFFGQESNVDVKVC